MWAYGRGRTDRQTHRRVWPRYILCRLRLMQNIMNNNIIQKINKKCLLCKKCEKEGEEYRLARSLCSQSHSPCHWPRLRWPFVIGIVTSQPVNAALTWAGYNIHQRRQHKHTTRFSCTLYEHVYHNAVCQLIKTGSSLFIISVMLISWAYRQTDRQTHTHTQTDTHLMASFPRQPG